MRAKERASASATSTFHGRRKPDRAELLERARDPQHQAVLILRRDDLKACRQARGGKAARDRGGGLLSQIEGKAKGRPLRPVRLIGSRRGEEACIECRERQGRREQHVE